ncbi:MAG: hypothetical protein LBL01_05320 [Bifidobacteriaceae bacterium]|nr:hypothetical protein [Bifidobacteriaceae bacterium]
MPRVPFLAQAARAASPARGAAIHRGAYDGLARSRRPALDLANAAAAARAATRLTGQSAPEGIGGT